MAATANWRLLSTAEAAERLNIPPQSVYHLVQDGHLTSVRIGRLHRFHPEELDRFIRAASGGGAS